MPEPTHELGDCSAMCKMHGRFLLKDGPTGELIDAVRAVAADGPPTSDRLSAQQRRWGSPGGRLTLSLLLTAGQRDLSDQGRTRPGGCKGEFWIGPVFGLRRGFRDRSG
jgi:hypothetical protein